MPSTIYSCSLVLGIYHNDFVKPSPLLRSCFHQLRSLRVIATALVLKLTSVLQFNDLDTRLQNSVNLEKIFDQAKASEVNLKLFDQSVFFRYGKRFQGSSLEWNWRRTSWYEQEMLKRFCTVSETVGLTRKESEQYSLTF